MEPKKTRDFMPAADQRAFVAAALAVGLPGEMIWDRLPHNETKGKLPDRTELEQHFARELNAGPLLALRLTMARVLQRALLADDAEGIAAQMAVLRSYKRWAELGEAKAAADFDAARLTRRERASLRKLLKKGGVR